MAGSRIRLLDGGCRLLAQLCPGAGPGWSLCDGVFQEALADTPGGRVPGLERYEMEDSGPEWLVEGAGVEKPGTACSGHAAVSQSVSVPPSVPQRTQKGTQGTLLLGGPRPGLLSLSHPTWLWRCPLGQSQAISGRDYGGLVLSVSSSDIAPQRGSLRGREGGGSGVSEHQLCAVMPAGRRTSFRHLRPQLGAPARGCQSRESLFPQRKPHRLERSLHASP